MDSISSLLNPTNFFSNFIQTLVRRFDTSSFNLDRSLGARASGTAIVVGVGSYLAFRAVRRFFVDSNFISTFLDNLNFDPLSDLRHITTDEGFYTIRRIKGTHRTKLDKCLLTLVNAKPGQSIDGRNCRHGAPTRKQHQVPRISPTLLRLMQRQLQAQKEGITAIHFSGPFDDEIPSTSNSRTVISRTTGLTAIIDEDLQSLSGMSDLTSASSSNLLQSKLINRLGSNTDALKRQHQTQRSPHWWRTICVGDRKNDHRASSSSTLEMKPEMAGATPTLFGGLFSLSSIRSGSLNLGSAFAETDDLFWDDDGLFMPGNEFDSVFDAASDDGISQLSAVRSIERLFKEREEKEAHEQEWFVDKSHLIPFRKTMSRNELDRFSKKSSTSFLKSCSSFASMSTATNIQNDERSFIRGIYKRTTLLPMMQKSYYHSVMAVPNSGDTESSEVSSSRYSQNLFAERIRGFNSISRGLWEFAEDSRHLIENKTHPTNRLKQKQQLLRTASSHRNFNALEQRRNYFMIDSSEARSSRPMKTTPMTTRTTSSAVMLRSDENNEKLLKTAFRPATLFDHHNQQREDDSLAGSSSSNSGGGLWSLGGDELILLSSSSQCNHDGDVDDERQRQQRHNNAICDGSDGDARNSATAMFDSAIVSDFQSTLGFDEEQ